MKYWISGFLLTDLLSFLTYYEPVLIPWVFILAVAIFFLVCYRHLELAILIVLAELFAGSKGYLFSLNLGDFNISIRLAFFTILLSFSLWHLLKQGKEALWLFIKWSKPVLILGLIVVLAFLHGLMRGYGFTQVFFDANAYFFIGLLLPLFIAAPRQGFMERVVSLLVYSAAYLSVKTLLLLYFFTHRFEFFLFDLYQWVRDTNVGEITWTTTGAWRVFMQSQIYIVVAWWIVMARMVKNNAWQRPGYIALLSLFSAALLISFSRSFWLGLVISVLAVGLWKLYQKEWPESIYFVLIGIVSFVFGFAIVIAVLRIPFPATSSTGTIDLSKRFEIMVEEAASSRWNLLPPLWKAVQKNFLVGMGFGAPVTYVSNDPRVRSVNPSGLYTTTAFEWGYLDIWLKIGLVGLLVYTLVVIKIFVEASRNKEFLSPALPGLIFGLVAVLGVNIGSPYLNHPLGLGLIILLYAYVIKQQSVRINS